MIYLDNAATTEMDPEVVDAMLPFLEECYGNPATPHDFGDDASQAVELARAQVAELIGASPEDIYFTSGATEANNWMLQGFQYDGRALVVSPIEHPSILQTAECLQSMGMDTAVMGVNYNGFILWSDVPEIEGRVGLVSAMLANNETGVIQDVASLSKLVHERGGLLHSDAAQAVGKIQVDVEELGVDFLSMSAHKVHGPKGVGALYIKPDAKDAIRPLLFGGHQERGMRSGTENVAAIVGMGKAFEITRKRMQYDAEQRRNMTEWFYREVTRVTPDIKLNGDLELRLPGTLNLEIPQVECSALLALLADEYKVYIACGSACSAKEVKPSHVLTAMGRSVEQAHNSMRLSVGRFNTMEDMNRVADLLASAIAKLRKERVM